MHGLLLEMRNHIQNHFQMNLLTPSSQASISSMDAHTPVHPCAHLGNYLTRNSYEESSFYNDDDFENDINEDKNQKLENDMDRMKELLNKLINDKVQWLKPVRYRTSTGLISNMLLMSLV